MVPTESLKGGPARLLRADAAMAAVILLLGFFLAGTGNSLVQRWRSSSARQQSVTFEDQLGILANTAGLIVITWWVMSLLIAFAAALLERGGRTRAAEAAGKFSPGFMRRLALAAVGFQLITAQLASAATPPAVPGTGPSPRTAVSAAWTPTSGASFAEGPDPAATVPATSAPEPPSRTTVPVADPQWKPLRPLVEPGPLASPQLRPQEPAAALRDITVRAGDSLWSLAAAELGPFASDVDIAVEWPRLYQANRPAIGENPDVLLPGQVLRLPPGT
ncbi:LysM peptidoglycan-binding domain-containing protein [Arthrobacter sp. PAMC25564]|uniref:LysM peptidoglycan-binding domain-containing protein n=1 Tax=Arthrobacter sp. PAMC25564 TaxID=2565366 RepID=UPI0010A20F52|nr:LysM peptidoglycan-binding domain-containing protein [Arthrobacter sp. PAMC25564]QCB96935.1 LysM peptidoglycan-binding domain-containing protein [Arthrobacter sp. PAMC25564]